MMETASQQDLKELTGKLAMFHHFFLHNDDTEQAEKTKQLLMKLHHQEYALAFCGHFSAGKSSMINQLIGENLLPSSPIPTSANLVKVKTGEEYAKVYFKEGNPRLYPAPYDYEKVKSYCKDGDAIQSIEISHHTNVLPTDVCIIDTPGIDSTDDAHRIATESALHLADLVFYVMDYNHVQSELNFLFTKELTDAGKELYLVINQIDKHRSEELSFEDFKESVKHSFSDWGVEPERIFYTSLREEKHPYNDFNRLKQFIRSKFEDKENLLAPSIYRSLTNLVNHHQQFLKDKDQAALDKYEEQLDGIPIEIQEQLPEQVEKARQSLQQISSLLREKEKEFEDGLDSILKSAYLMPFETRSFAESYLEATDPDFKVGLFFSKQKTEQERAERLERFSLDFQEKINTQITWHLKEFLSKRFKQEEIDDMEVLTKVQELSVKFPKEMLANAVKKGARVSGQYVLNYTADVAELAKKSARQAVRELKENYLEIVKSKLHQQERSLQQEFDKWSHILHAWKKQEEIVSTQTTHFITMEQILTGEKQPYKKEDLLTILSEEMETEVITEATFEEETVEKKAVKQDEAVKEQNKPFLANNTERMEAVVRKLRFTSQKLEDVPGFKKISSHLKDKAKRLEEKGFTVALFGAFSAGKSSFANSLIGEKLLPVSPNPTTAAINKIMPIDENHPHGMVKVQFKQAQVLYEDINRSLGVFEVQAHSFDEALTQIKEILEHKIELDVYEKTHYSFLRAFFHGFDAYRHQLGKVLETDLKSFQDFVANEEKSCLVERIDVHYDCEITRKGITLVDTPGADSINARHTGVAFDYIKNSDAILFVTYYNHAFSKADREFLIQLGRVKDAFEMDKMFFVVNAVDLANDGAEKEEVLSYVKEELVRFGIRNPSLYPVSSLLAIQEKLGQLPSSQSGIHLFEEQFYAFISNDLTQIAIDAATAEWERALEQLRSYIHSAKEDKHLKQARIASLNAEMAEAKRSISNQTVERIRPRITQEIEELIYYLKQRVFLRFHDFFIESFNPSLLRDDGRNLKKTLERALEDFLTSIGFDFSQELRATTLRIETYMGKLLGESYQTVTKELLLLNDDLSFSQYQLGQVESLDFQNTLVALDRGMFKKALAYFKHPKSFFEKNEKRFMEESLQEILQAPVDTYLENEKNRLMSHYENALIHEFSLLLQLIHEDTKEYYQGMLATLSNHLPIDTLIKLEEEITHFE
ncbi:dynamin family protein [Robertmurraya massiliosenegalensis]|uniref:dynamin family protein n=1 Tax=Robertmurraya massiliosenegalensis TaxID=1287657 RepID=UPI00030DBE47|nr:dynamin family protein [Robertmurraya massiliosenegalensis]